MNSSNLFKLTLPVALLASGLGLSIPSTPAAAQSVAPTVASPFVFYKRFTIRKEGVFTQVQSQAGRANQGPGTSTPPAPPPNTTPPSDGGVVADANPDGKPVIPLASMNVVAGNFLEGQTSQYLPSPGLPSCQGDGTDTVYSTYTDASGYRVQNYFRHIEQTWDRSGVVQFSRPGVVSTAMNQAAPGAFQPTEPLAQPLSFHITMPERPTEEFFSANSGFRQLVATEVEFVANDGSVTALSGWRAGLVSQYPNSTSSYCRVQGVSPTGGNAVEQASREMFLAVALTRDLTKDSVSGTVRVRFDNDYSGTLEIPVQVTMQYQDVPTGVSQFKTAGHVCSSNQNCPATGQYWPDSQNKVFSLEKFVLSSDYDGVSRGSPLINRVPQRIDTYLELPGFNNVSNLAVVSPMFVGVHSAAAGGPGIAYGNVLNNPLAGSNTLSGNTSYPYTFEGRGRIDTSVAFNYPVNGLAAGAYTELLNQPVFRAGGFFNFRSELVYEVLKQNFQLIHSSPTTLVSAAQMTQKTAKTSDAFSIRQSAVVPSATVADLWFEPVSYASYLGHAYWNLWKDAKPAGATPTNHTVLAGMPVLNVTLSGPDAGQYEPLLVPYTRSAVNDFGKGTRTLGSKVNQPSYCVSSGIAYRGQTYQCRIKELLESGSGTITGVEVRLRDRNNISPIRPGNVTVTVTHNSEAHGPLTWNVTLTN